MKVIECAGLRRRMPCVKRMGFADWAWSGRRGIHERCAVWKRVVGLGMRSMYFHSNYIFLKTIN